MLFGKVNVSGNSPASTAIALNAPRDPVMLFSAYFVYLFIIQVWTFPIDTKINLVSSLSAVYLEVNPHAVFWPSIPISFSIWVID